ncbi:UPF0415 protein C7orf25 homolog [Cylas formicarius]|uniref:UPF0415 protein C7orf25 homolog n=1 Tax=Cylas formicarius TaxID=197179 RepID=UPI002958B2C8|nr:UPF0415 protein C7orf25 homolog [Cylas formicarius]
MSENNFDSESTENLYSLAKEKIEFGESLKSYVSRHKDIEGLQKLARKINQELKFLRKVCRDRTLKKEHLQCSNLTHFSALIDTLSTIKNCESVNKVYCLEDRKVTVDIVCDNGLTWIKVIARNPKSLSQICMGNSSYGTRSIIDQASEYVQCAKLYPCLFQTPKVIFVFVNGIGSNLSNKLKNCGVTVVGARSEDYDIAESDSDLSDDENVEKPSCTDLSTINATCIKKINLDVSAMLAYCCSVANGSAYLYDFHVPVLKQQAEWERQRPVKPILDNFFEGKTLYCCETAKTSFKNIVNTVGGSNEKIRSKELLERVVVLPDNATYKETLEGSEGSEIFRNVQFTPDKVLKLGGKIRQRSLTIFLFGDRIQAVTVTSNDGFIRAAKQQNINFVVFVHESRALTEQKEHTKAIPFSS